MMSHLTQHKFFILKLCLLIWTLVILTGFFWQVYEGSFSSKSLYFPLTSFSVILVLGLFGYSQSILWGFSWFSLLCLSVLGVHLCLGIDTKLRDFTNALSFACGCFATIGLGVYCCLRFKHKFISPIIKTIVLLFTILIVFLPLSIWDYYLAVGELLTSDIILAFAQTNYEESFEYVISHIDINWFWALLITVMVIMVTIFSLNRVSFIKHRAKSYAFMYICVLIFGQFFLVVPHINYFGTTVLKVTGRQLEQFTLFKEATLKRQERLAKLDTLGVDPKAKGIHVLVLGESHCRDRMQVYGYNRKNTPNLFKSKQQGQALIFSKAYASFPQTVPALTYALTEQNQYTYKKLEEAYSLIELANISGYETYWLSNQRKYGIYETPTSVISSAAMHEEWINGTSGMQSIFYDDELLNRLPDLKDKEQVFLILHLMGSHQKYAERSPEEYKIFLSKDKVVDEYDASILFMDNFLDKLYKKLSNYSNFQTLTFISDHGEELSHGIYDHNPTKFTFPMVRIPLVIYLGPNFKYQRQNVYTALRAHLDKVWTNDLTFELECGLLGIYGLESYSSAYDISSRQYRLTAKQALTLHGKKHIHEDQNFDNQESLTP